MGVHRMLGHRRKVRPVAAVVLWSLFVCLGLSVPRSAQAQAVSAVATRLVETFITALNNKDGKLLASLYGDARHRLCTDLDTLVFNEVSGTQATAVPLTLDQLARSRATLTGPPGAALLPDGGFIVIFGVTWTFLLAGETEEQTLRLTIEWRVQRQGEAYKIVAQKTTDLDDDYVCPG